MKVATWVQKYLILFSDKEPLQEHKNLIIYEKDRRIGYIRVPTEENGRVIAETLGHKYVSPSYFASILGRKLGLFKLTGSAPDARKFKKLLKELNP